MEVSFGFVWKTVKGLIIFVFAIGCAIASFGASAYGAFEIYGQVQQRVEEKATEEAAAVANCYGVVQHQCRWIIGIMLQSVKYERDLLHRRQIAGRRRVCMPYEAAETDKARRSE